MKRKLFLLFSLFILVISLCSCNKEHVHVFEEGICSCGEKEVKNVYSICFKDINGDIIEIVEVEEGKDASLPDAPLIDGFIFVSWSDDCIDVREDMEVYPIYEKEKIVVGKDKLYKSLQDAIDNSVDGDIIYIESGVFEGAVIDKSVEIRGSNYNISANANRVSESIFTSDIVINASDVIINGVSLTENAKFTFDGLTCDVDNIQFYNCKIFNSTVNDNFKRDVAPFNLVSNNNYFIKNVLIDDCLVDAISIGRPMAIYIVDVDGLIVRNSFFLGGNRKISYNDAIKVDDNENANSLFGIRGDVIIENNVFKNYYQYAIWFREYGNGSYLIKNNFFENIGQNLDSHAAVNFIKGIDLSDVEINVLNNSVKNGNMLFRIDDLELGDARFVCNVNNNVLIECSSTFFIKNSVEGLMINAQGNYYGEDVYVDKFYGDVDYSNYYEEYYDVLGFERIDLFASSKAYLEVGEEMGIDYQCFGFDPSEVKWRSLDESIALVNQDGIVCAVGEGSVEIVCFVDGLGISNSIMIEVYEDIDDLEEVELFLLSIMNTYSYSSTAANSRKNYGFVNPYYYSLYRSATAYLFEDLIIDEDSYVRHGLESLVNNRVEYITIHDTWALTELNAAGLADFFVNDETSIHYTVGNDGIYNIIRLGEKAAHAGDGKYRAYALEKTNVLAGDDKPVITMIDGCFAINGVKTDLRPYVDQEGTILDMNDYTSDQITYSGIRCVVGDDGYYYLGKTYFNETYKTISNFGGNANSIGIEMESLVGTDFFLNIHRTAKLVAMLLDKYDLSTDDVKMHNYFSGKNCAQLLKNNLKYELDYQIDKHNIEDILWDEFLYMCDVELKMREYCEKYSFEFISSDESILTNSGRVIDHRVNSVCVPYSIRITNLESGEISYINSSIVVPSALDIDVCFNIN